MPIAMSSDKRWLNCQSPFAKFCCSARSRKWHTRKLPRFWRFPSALSCRVCIARARRFVPDCSRKLRENRMACDAWSDKLDAYVDGELPVPEASALARHLRECPNCALDAFERVQMKRSVAIAGKRYEPTSQLRNKIEHSIKAPSRGAIPWAWRIVALPALLILIISLSMSF